MICRCYQCAPTLWQMKNREYLLQHCTSKTWVQALHAVEMGKMELTKEALVDHYEKRLRALYHENRGLRNIVLDMQKEIKQIKKCVLYRMCCKKKSKRKTKSKTKVTMCGCKR